MHTCHTSSHTWARCCCCCCFWLLPLHLDMLPLRVLIKDEQPEPHAYTCTRMFVLSFLCSCCCQVASVGVVPHR